MLPKGRDLSWRLWLETGLQGGSQPWSVFDLQCLQWREEPLTGKAWGSPTQVRDKGFYGQCPLMAIFARTLCCKTMSVKSSGPEETPKTCSITITKRGEGTVIGHPSGGKCHALEVSVMLKVCGSPKPCLGCWDVVKGKFH